MADRRNIDLKLLLWESLRNTTIRFSFNHVKAHQDDDTPYEDLDLPAKLNYHCDAAARRHLQTLTGPSPTFSPTDKGSSYLLNQRLNGRVTLPFQEEITERRYS